MKPTVPAQRTAAAQAARQRTAEAALERTSAAIAKLRREKTPITVAAVARRAGVSRTFLYDNPHARAAIAAAITDNTDQRRRRLEAQDAAVEATWRERALNAEDGLKASSMEIKNQRARIAQLLGQIRDLTEEWNQETIQRVTSENTTLKQRVRQLTGDNRTLEERLAAARSNLRFQDKRIAELEAGLLGSGSTPPTGISGQSRETACAEPETVRPLFRTT